MSERDAKNTVEFAKALSAWYGRTFLAVEPVTSQVRARKAIQYRLRRAIRRAPVLDRDYTVRDVWAVVEGM